MAAFAFYSQLLFFFKVTLSSHGHADETDLAGVFKDALTSELPTEKSCIHKLFILNKTHIMPT